MRFLFDLRIGILIGLIVFISSCIGGSPSPTPRFYLLSPIQSDSVVSNDNKDLSIAVEMTETQVPEYLARPQIVTRKGTSELMLAEFDRWAEPLSGQLFQVMMENLSNLLTDSSIRVQSTRKGSKVDYKLEVQIIQMDGKPGEALTLIARWTLINSDGGEVKRFKRTRIAEPILAADYHALVAAHSLAINKLSREIAEEIRLMVQP